MSEQPFYSLEIFPGIHHIAGGWCDCYLVEGGREAMMIDAGCREHNIRAFAQGLTDLPVNAVINTHSHIDHTGGNGYFARVLGTRGIARSAKNVMGDDPARFPLDYRFTLVGDGDIIDLGERRLEVIMMDCHSPENIAILDIEERVLFTGDDIESQQVLLLPGYAEAPGQIHSRPAASVETFLRALMKLKARERDFDHICPAHNGTPIEKEYLHRYISLAQGILDGSITGDPDCASASYNASLNHFPNPDAHYRRASQNGVSLVYCDRLLRDADYTQAGDLPPATRAHILSAGTAMQ